MSEFTYWREIASYVPSTEFLWVPTNTPATAALTLFTRTQSDRSSFDDALDILARFQAQNGDTRSKFVNEIFNNCKIPRKDYEPLCMFCLGLYSEAMLRLDHSKMTKFQHLTVHHDAEGDVETEVFESEKDAKDFSNSRLPIAKPGIKGSYDGDECVYTDWKEVSEWRTPSASSSTSSYLQFLEVYNSWSGTPQGIVACDCNSSSAVFLAVNYEDQFAWLAEIPSTTQSFNELENGDLSWGDIEKIASKKWQSIAAPNEDWNTSQLIWIGCIDCAKPHINVNDSSAGLEYISRALNEVGLTEDAALLKDLEDALLAIVANQFKLSTWSEEMEIDRLVFKSLVESLPENVKKQTPRLINSLDQ